MKYLRTSYSLLSVQNIIRVLLLPWLLQRHVVAIPKSVRKERIAETFNIFDFDLNTEDIEAIASLDTNQNLFLDHRDLATVEAIGEVRFDI